MTAGQTLVAHFVDECVEQGRPHMVKTLKGPVAQRIGILLRDGCTVEELKPALTELVRRNSPNAMRLHEIALELATADAPDPAERHGHRRNVKDWIEAHGWPTGARFVRGAHSGTYKYDPLGTEPLPRGYAWPHGRPSFDEIARALVEGENGGSDGNGAASPSTSALPPFPALERGNRPHPQTPMVPPPPPKEDPDG